MIFVNLMSDLFHDGVPLSYISGVVATMTIARWHNYRVLTKRSEQVRQLLSGPLCQAASEAHIWWGVSVEDRKYGLLRIADGFGVQHRRRTDRQLENRPFPGRVLFKDLPLSHPFAKPSKNIPHGNAQATHARLASALSRLDADAAVGRH
jgi:hypothetical protein